MEEAAEAEGRKRRSRALRSLSALILAMERRGLNPQEFGDQLASISKTLGKGGGSGKLSKEYEALKHSLERDHKLVVPDHYRNQWLALGMPLFGLPFGVVIALAVDNFPLVGVGLPMGMLIGVAVGTALDRRAAAEGRVLDMPPEN